MKDTKEQTIKELIENLHIIEDKRNKLDEEENKIIYELWDRIPTLKLSDVFQPVGKEKTKIKED